MKQKRQGFSVEEAALTDLAKWTKERLKDIAKPRDTRPGWNMVNSPSVYLAVMAQAVPSQSALTAAELKQIAGHLLRHQEADGSWAWSLAPAENRCAAVLRVRRSRNDTSLNGARAASAGGSQRKISGT